MQAAIRQAEFETLGNGSLDNLFIVIELDVAGTYLLGTSGDILVVFFYWYTHVTLADMPRPGRLSSRWIAVGA